MTRIFKLSFAIILLVLSVSEFASAQGFNSVSSSDGINVMAVGNNGNVYRSLNGGVSYSSYPVGSINLNSVSMKGTEAWIAGDNGIVLYTSNGGGSFTPFTYTTQNLRSVHFIDNNKGWVVGNGGTIGKTVNKGETWTPQISPVTANLRSVKFRDEMYGVACGDGGTVIVTTNGGTTWNEYTSPTDMDLLSVDVKGSTIIATGADGSIFKHNGISWLEIDFNFEVKSEVRGVSMLDENNFYVTGGGGFIQKTGDAGVSFTFQANPMMATTSSICFADANNGWAVASTNNAILRTSNGGMTWQFQTGVTKTYSFTRKQQTSGNIGNPFALHPKNKNGAFILAGTSLYRTLDKGETWTLLASGIPGGSCHSFHVNANDTNIMVAAKGSSGGRIIRSTDYGQTWTNLISPINLTSYGMPLQDDPNNPDNLFLAPDNAPMRKSTNYGTDWITLSGGENGGIFRSPCDVVIQYGNSDVIIVGDGTTGSGQGKVWKSVNGGMNWTLINTVSGSEIPMIASTSLIPDLYYHSTWSSGSFWKSTNNGSNFTNLNQSGSLWATDIAKDDPTAVCFNEYGNEAFISVDGGVTFVMQDVGSSPAAGMLYFDKANLLIQQGGGVYKLNINYTVLTSVAENLVSSVIPSSFDLSQNYPNPFNPSTKIKFALPSSGNVSLVVFDRLGREIEVLANGFRNAGTYEINFDASSLSSGIYFYKITTGSFTETKKMMLVK